MGINPIYMIIKETDNNNTATTYSTTTINMTQLSSSSTTKSYTASNQLVKSVNISSPSNFIGSLGNLIADQTKPFNFASTSTANPLNSNSIITLTSSSLQIQSSNSSNITNSTLKSPSILPMQIIKTAPMAFPIGNLIAGYKSNNTNSGTTNSSTSTTTSSNILNRDMNSNNFRLPITISTETSTIPTQPIANTFLTTSRTSSTKLIESSTQSSAIFKGTSLNSGYTTVNPTKSHSLTSVTSKIVSRNSKKFAAKRKQRNRKPKIYRNNKKNSGTENQLSRNKN